MSSYSPIALDTLPAPQVIEPLDAETIIAAIKADVIERAPELEAVLELESEPIVKLIEAAAFREFLLRARINDAARAVMLAHATGADLENLAALLGVARLDGETDEKLRARAVLAFEGFSTAGPVGAYEFHARSAHAEVKDVAVSSPAPGVVQIAVLSTVGNGVPAQGVLDAVFAAVNADDVRPLTDMVQVVSAAVVDYEVTAEITFDGTQDPTAALAAIEVDVQAYADAQHRLNTPVSLVGIYAALNRPGVVQATLSSPAADIPSGVASAAYCVAITLTEAAA